ncbi:zinc metallopeptidase [Paenibacillus sp. KN14-4R]|uniref:zinc metallopeptidase n=1 Tax=Paenibacillus sp. KN14-4R TaxID=3445773 RepID=UPI003FA00BF6
MFPFYFHWMDFVILGAFLLSMWASFRVRGTFNKWGEVPNQSGLTGYEAARRMLDYNDLHDVPVEPVRGALSDHYDPIARVVRLSEPVYYEKSISAVSVACHEVGHAIQHKVHYPMLVLRHRMFPAVNFASGVAPFLILGGFIFQQFKFLLPLGIIFFAVAVLFQLVTLPVEFNASNRARELMVSNGFITNEEERGVAKVLNAAALTYVAAALISVLQLLKYIMIANSRND